MAINYAEVDKFNKVVIVYNRNSGKQLFASMIMKINEIYKRLKDALGSKQWSCVKLSALTISPLLLML